METELFDNPVIDAVEVVQPINDENTHFIGSHASGISLNFLRNNCIIPVFAKDNESTISHAEFIQTVMETATNMFPNESIQAPVVKVSHPIKGRIPEAMGKPANILREDEKTIYYERMAFVAEIPSIREKANGNELCLSIGGVRAYNLENLHNKKSEEKFKVFIGFQNRVCTNLCISTDGLKADIRADSLADLASNALQCFTDYGFSEDLKFWSNLGEYSLNENQFAQLIGKSKMYNYMPPKLRKEIQPFPLMDSQISTITREYYGDKSFCRDSSGGINLWRLYSLFTSANKSSYIDTFLDRSAGCNSFVAQLMEAVRHNNKFWYLN